ncbi:unnamed protein product [Vicia faba]|uniref:Uncharacterized protein n=1 Tax=Vicia faba TaxID=3906 RepID=A0AAV1AF92_VICFA|nr:unnamed protein product [Vicia faba]
MNIEPKTEPDSPPWPIPTNPNNFENKSIEDLIGILRGTYQFEIFDIVEGVLVSKKDELERSVKKNLGTIKELRRANSKLADEKRRVEELLESSNTKFRGLNERVGKLENDVIFLLSVDASGDCENEGDLVWSLLLLILKTKIEMFVI